MIKPSLSAEKRALKRELEAKIREIERPEWLAGKARRAAERAAMKARVGKRAAGQREERELDTGFLAYLRRLPCIAGLVLGHGCGGKIEAAHIRYSAHGKGRNPGLQRKNHDRHATPLCHLHHQCDQHTRSEIAFWADLGIDAYDFAAALYADYQAGGDGAAVLRRFLPTTQGASR